MSMQKSPGKASRAAGRTGLTADLSAEGQTSIEYLFIIGGALTAIVIVSAFIIGALFTPQPQAHCEFSAFSNLARLGPLDVNIHSPNSCTPRILARANSNPVATGQARIYAGAMDCDSSNSTKKSYVNGVALFLTDPNSKIICADPGNTSLVNSQYSPSLAVSYSPIDQTPGADTCTNPTGMDFGLRLASEAECAISDPGYYNLQIRARNNTGQPDHSDYEPKAIVVK